jgi:glycosyltransferase involved in cell wall biosynthesis
MQRDPERHSLTDTFGPVLLEALASGVPVAAFPAAAPRDVIGEAPVGRLDDNLQRACLEALECSREECRAFALKMTWEESARIFLTHVAEANNKVVRMRRLWLRRRRRPVEPLGEVPLTDQDRARVSR